MRLFNIKHLQPLNALSYQPSVLCIGNFDGVHRGHQQMIQLAKTLANEQQLTLSVMFFDPQPIEFFAPDQAPARLTNWQEKVRLLTQYGVKQCFMAYFDDAFRRLSAHEFCAWLTHLNVKALVVGDDFKFGFDRSGDAQLLKNQGFMVQQMPTYSQHNERISSTLVRQQLINGSFDEAQNLLGRPYSINGRVVYGDQIGRTIDFPTANIALKRLKPALHGIYAASVQGSDAVQHQRLLSRLTHSTQQGLTGLIEGSLYACAHVGVRPAIEQQQPEWRLELFFPELSAHLYGLKLTVTFHHFLHGERNYPSLEALKQGIQQDVVDLLAYRQQHLKLRD